MKHRIITAFIAGLLTSILLMGCGKETAPLPETVTDFQTPIATNTEKLSTEEPHDSPTKSLPTEAIQPTLESSIDPAYVDMQISTIDGMTLVLVPAGEFLMGSEKGMGNNDEEPQHPVKMKAYWIDQTEVTNGMYAKCVNAGICSPPKFTHSYSHADYFGNTEYSDFPVIYVDWFQAKKYCQWANRRLPTEAEWEMAARGNENFTFPWGNIEPDQTLANYHYQSSDVLKTGSYPKGASPYGVLDMAGNVYEWVSDWYGFYQLYTDPSPQGPASGKYHIVRGGSWITGQYLIRSADRYWVTAYFVDEDTGFRCALSE